MSATAYAEPLILPAGTAPTTEFRRPPLLRLAAIELRKMTDTRSGFWLMLTVAALAIGLAALQLIVAKPDEQTGAQVFIAALLPVGSLLPVVGILAAAATPVGSGFDLTAGALLNGLLFAVISILIGVAFGMLFQTPALAIVLYFVVPIIGELATGLVPALQGVGGWINQSDAMTPLLENHMGATGWAKLATTLAFWLVLPLTLGVIRLLRREVK